MISNYIYMVKKSQVFIIYILTKVEDIDVEKRIK